MPEVDHDSGSLRISWLLRLLTGQGYSVTFHPRFAGRFKYIQQMRFYGINVVPLGESLVLTGPEKACLYDLFIVSRPDDFQQYISTIKLACPNALIIFDTVDVHFLREARNVLSAGQ